MEFIMEEKSFCMGNGDDIRISKHSSSGSPCDQWRGSMGVDSRGVQIILFKISLQVVRRTLLSMDVRGEVENLIFKQFWKRKAPPKGGAWGTTGLGMCFL